jgi:hypothetical protein
MRSKSGDTLGIKYNRLTPIEIAGKNKHSKTLVKCLCDCGQECIVIEARVRNGLTQSCGCYKNETTSARTKIDMTGQKLGRLTFIKEVAKPEALSIHWECLCDCGNTAIINGTLARVGHTMSCGCLKQERLLASVTTHGKSSDPTYFLWNGMHQRCYNTKHHSYKNYGERGIKICDRWHDFENFYEDMGDKPEGLSIERLDVNGDYCPENCIWDNSSNQAFNIRLRTNNTSGRTGVTLDEGLWLARIWKNKICYTLGRFEKFEEAVAAREKAELELYGFTKD